MQRVIPVLALLPSLLLAPAGSSRASDAANVSVGLREVYDTAYDAYLYAYPLVTMDVTMRQATNVEDSASVPMRAPPNQFAHYREYPGADARDVVRFNFDTLYSFAWLDLREEPVVLSLPGTRERYYLMPMLDMWTDVFAAPGTRTTGNEAGDYLIVGPSWDGDASGEWGVIKAPTPIVWLMGRTQTNGPDDFERVHAVQDQYSLTPLSRWRDGKRGPFEGSEADGQIDPEVDNETPPLLTVNALSGVEVLRRLVSLTSIHPPHHADYPIMHSMARVLGLKLGESWDTASLDENSLAMINEAARDAQNDLREMINEGALGDTVNGWNYATNLGSYGTDYLLRAMVALAGLGANLGRDAVYPNAFQDATGRPTTGEHAYTIHFPAGQLPPANAFWSVTMYDEDGFQVPNELDRFAIGDRDDLNYNPDGSLTLYIQHEKPGTEELSNWLPAPQGPFQVMMRIYYPERAALKQGLQLPPLRRQP